MQPWTAVSSEGPPVSSRVPAHFTIKLTALGLSPEHAARLARDCEQMLRDRVGDEIEVHPVRFVSSNMSAKTAAWSKRVRTQLRVEDDRRRWKAERERLERLEHAKSGLEKAAGLAGEDIEVVS